MAHDTTTRGVATDPTIAELAIDFDLSLTAQNKSKATRKVYGTAVAKFAAFLAERGMPAEAVNITREHVETFIADLLATRSASTAKTRYGGLQVFFNWLVEEGELTRSPMERMKPPAVPEQPVAIVDDDAVKRLLKVTEGTGFAERRDHAIIRLFLASGVRRGELAALKVSDLDFDASPPVAWVLGKGGRRRAAPFDHETALALRRYLRVRARHAHCAAPWLWLGKLGPFGDAGIQQMLQRRGAEAGVEGIHAHAFRHTFAHQWLADGGTEGDLMRLAGWRNRAMLDRYGRSVAEERALDAYRRRRAPDGR